MKTWAWGTVAAIACGVIILEVATGVTRSIAAPAKTRIYKSPKPSTKFGRLLSSPVGTIGRGKPKTCPKTALPLAALVPFTGKSGEEVSFAQTVSERPVWWFYSPYDRATKFEATLLVKNPMTNAVVASETISLSEKPGIIRVQFPSTAPALQPDVLYQWSFQVNCELPPPKTFGWVQRLDRPPLSPSKPSSFEAQFEHYAQQGLWFEALTTLGDRRLAQPQDKAAETAWQALLAEMYDAIDPPSPEMQSQLRSIAQQPIVP
jgi:Domain of Unknown Function (DUF928)